MEFRTMQICYQMIIPYVSFPMLAFIASEERSLTVSIFNLDTRYMNNDESHFLLRVMD